MNRLGRFFSRWINWVAVLIVLIYFAAAIAAPYLSPQDPDEPGMYLRVGRAVEGKPLPPSEKAILGMLPHGYDVFHSLIWGSRDALQFGLIVALTTASFGILYGAIAGLAGTRTSIVMLRIADAFLAVPPIAGLVLLQQLLSSTLTAMAGVYFDSRFYGLPIEIPAPSTAIEFILEHVNPLMLSLIVFSWMPYARLVNSMVITLRQTDFIQAARALGGSSFWIIRKHLLQNATGPAMVLAARDVGGVVLLQATLTFVQIGGGSVWGSMLAQGRDWVIGPGGSLLRYWWVFLPPTLAVMIFGISWNILGDGLNDVFETGARGSIRGGSFWRRKPRTQKEALPEDALPVAQLVVKLQAPPNLPHATKSVDGADPILGAAREDIFSGDLTRGLHAYQHLIRRGRHVQEILSDLAQLARTHPRDPQIWHTLGDALTSAGDSEHATQSYNQAQKLKS